MICSICSALPLKDPSCSWSVPHYSTFRELDESVQNGCQICVLFRRVLLEYYAHGLSCSVEEAEHYQRQLDREPKRRDAEYLDPEEEDQRDRHEERAAFFAEVVPSDIDSNFAPYSRGLQGLLYLRKCPGEDSLPVKEIYPFVEVSSLSSMHIPRPQY